MQEMLFSLSGLMLVATLCFGQAGRAELFGTIRDPSGLPVPTAKVAAEDQATMARYPVVSDERGEYHIVGLPAGRYVLTVEQPGFHIYRQSGITLRLADRTAIDVQLEVGQPSQSVDVTAAASLLQTASGDGESERGCAENIHAASGWTQLHSLGHAVSGRGAAQRPVPAANQRQPPAHQRVHLRRHQRAAAGAGAGGLLPDHRRHGRIQTQRQRLFSRVWPFQRRHCNGDWKIRKQSVPRKPV